MATRTSDVMLKPADKRNVFDPAMFAAIVSTGQRLKNEPGVRVVALLFEGADFCAGLDFEASKP